jgi:hypothetical protein
MDRDKVLEEELNMQATAAVSRLAIVGGIFCGLQAFAIQAGRLLIIDINPAISELAQGRV